MTAGNLNASALPVVSIYQNSIGAIELNSADIGKLTENYSGLARQTLTVSLNHNIAPGPAVVVGTLNVPGAVAGFHVVQVGQVGLYPLYTGYVSATDTVVVTARDNVANAALASPGWSEIESVHRLETGNIQKCHLHIQVNQPARSFINRRIVHAKCAVRFAVL